jgi:putative spermidine/putrescine transport system permease protein
VVLNQQDLAKALALGMILVVALVMWGYALLQRRTARWLT